MRNAVEPPESRKELHPNGHTHTNHASEHVCTSQEDTQSGSRLGRIAVIVAILVLLLVVIPVAVIVSGRSSSKDERTTPSAMDDVPLPVPTSPFVPSPSDPTSPTTIGSPPIPATLAPTQKPTAEPTHRPTHRPTMEAPPTISPQPTRSAQPSATPSQMPSTSAPSAMPSISLAPTTAVLENIRLALEPVVANPDALWDVSTPEAAALAWMARNEWVEPDRIEQRYALLTLDFATQGLERRPPVTSRRHGSRHLRALQQGAMTLTANEVLWEPLFSRNQLPDECQWFGVTCTNGIVTALIRPDLQLGGTIPQDIRLLRNLTNLDLGENQLRGTIPETLFQCTLLRELYLHDNLLTGTISNNFAQLTDLQKVFLSDNRFTGTFPDGFSSPARTLGRPLRFLTVYNNSLTGPLPRGTNWRNMYYLDVGRNQLTGTLPSDWWDGLDTMREIRHLYLSHNQFSGTIPSAFTTMGNGRMNLVVINNNQFEGEFPGSWNPRHFLEVTEFQNNNFRSMGSDLCRMIVFNGGELTTMGVDCPICRCGGLLCRVPYCTA